MCTLCVVVVMYGLQALVDWTWFIPGVTVVALVAAGWLAGRGALQKLAERRPRALPAGTAVAALAGVAAVVVLCAWAMLGPLRSTDADNAALTALGAGNTAGALSDARTAANSDPLAYQPLWTEAKAYAQAGDRAAALAAYRQAVSVQPGNSATWLVLGEYELTATPYAQSALSALTTAHRLDLATADFAVACADARVRQHRLPPSCRSLL
jgi:tetratricopeptide (TPR) repeat protein